MCHGLAEGGVAVGSGSPTCQGVHRIGCSLSTAPWTRSLGGTGGSVWSSTYPLRSGRRSDGSRTFVVDLPANNSDRVGDGGHDGRSCVVASASGPAIRFRILKENRDRLESRLQGSRSNSRAARRPVTCPDHLRVPEVHVRASESSRPPRSDDVQGFLSGPANATARGRNGDRARRCHRSSV